MKDGHLFSLVLPSNAASRARLLDALGDCVVEVRPNDVVLELYGSTGSFLVRALSPIQPVVNVASAPAIVPPVWDPPAPGGYHDCTSLEGDINALKMKFGSVVETECLGRTLQNRAIWSFRVKAVAKTRRRVLLVGGHHACERISVEIPYRIGLEIAQHRWAGRTMGEVDGIELVVVPMLNPDGHEFFSANHDDYPDWRKNKRPNPPPLPPLHGAYGVDLNRNYGFMWSTGDASPVPLDWRYCGTSAFSELETGAIRSLLAAEAYDGLLTYHSYGQKILHPWASSYGDGGDPRIAPLVALAGAMAAAGSYAGQQYQVLPASNLYPEPVGGELCDWALSEHDLAALTVELPPASPSPGFWLPASEISRVFEGHYPAALTFLSAVADGWKK